MAAAFGSLVTGPSDSLAQKQDKRIQRCYELSQQFTAIAEKVQDAPEAQPAIEKGRRGVSRCDGSAYFVGAKLLEEAIEELGERPVSAD